VDDRIRTGDRLDHNQELYQLSYVHRAGVNLAGLQRIHQRPPAWLAASPRRPGCAAMFPSWSVVADFRNKMPANRSPPGQICANSSRTHLVRELLSISDECVPGFMAKPRRGWPAAKSPGIRESEEFLDADTQGFRRERVVVVSRSSARGLSERRDLNLWLVVVAFQARRGALFRLAGIARGS
jgi:hypothetical protein